MPEQSTTAAPQHRERPSRRLQPVLLHTASLSDVDRRAIRELMDSAFAGDFDDDDFDHALGGMHAAVWHSDGSLIGHASVVQRQVLVEDRSVRCGYVEAVAVRADQGRQGIGGALMAAVENVIAGAYDIGALGASEQGRGLYLRRGWRVWTGELGVLSPDGYRRTPDDEGGVMVWTATSEPLRGTRLACDWRAGDVW